MSAPWVFDIGLHRGEDTAFYLKKGYRVAAFEAHPELAAHCRRRFADAIADGRCVIYEGAVVGRDSVVGGRVEFFSNRILSTWGTAKPAWMRRNAMLGAGSDVIDVGVVDLAGVIRDIGMPYYAKVDIEGYDRQAVEEILAFGSPPPFLSMESEKVEFDLLVAEIDLLCRSGYHRFMAVQQHTVPGSIIATQTIAGAPIEHRFEQDASGAFGPDLGGRWLSRDQVITQYRAIFREYAQFGEFSPLRGTPEGRAYLAQQERALGRPLPGWYDTHARLD